MFFFGIFVLLVWGILENALIVYLRTKKQKVPFFKSRTFVSRFLKKKNKDSENHELNLGKYKPKCEHLVGEKFIFMERYG